MKKTISFLFIFFSISCFSREYDNKLWYSAPAWEWTEALPVGNGRLGAMVYGIPGKEEIQINEETVWGGGPRRNDNPNALKALSEVRNLVFGGRNQEAQSRIDKDFKTPRNGMPYQTIGSLFLEFSGHENYSDYYRELDISKAKSLTTYKAEGITYTRELFSSFTDNVLIMKITADKKGALNFIVSYNSPMTEFTVKKMETNCY